MSRMIETERLILRPLTVDDDADVFEWVSDPIVNRYMPYSLYQNLEQVKNRIQSIATEAAKALIQWVYSNLNAREFVAKHANANTTSGKVIQKCGFVFDRYAQYSKFDGSETFDAFYYKMHLELRKRNRI